MLDILAYYCRIICLDNMAKIILLVRYFSGSCNGSVRSSCFMKVSVSCSGGDIEFVLRHDQK